MKHSTNSLAVPPTLRWSGDVTGKLFLLDQTLLPSSIVEIACDNVEKVWEAVRALRVRGAPAIGVAAAYGVVLGLQDTVDVTRTAFDSRLDDVIKYLASSRPTARNLFWALERMERLSSSLGEASPCDIVEKLLAEARKIEAEDREQCAAIGRAGACLLRDGNGILTHCNAGGLATVGDGTALSVIFAAAAEGKSLHVFVDETRPLFQGARLTAWELTQRNVPCTLICDSAAAWVMKQRKVQAVVTGADRIAANGDTANKIGTYSLALSARAHGVPFYVAAPSTTFDLSLTTGADIPIEQRPAEEIAEVGGKRTAPLDINILNPAFDVTPAEYITALITEYGLIEPVTESRIRKALCR